MNYAFAGIFTIGLIANSGVAANWWEPLVASGPIGVVLCWFMLRMEKKSAQQTEAIFNMQILLADTILALKHGDDSIAELAARCKQQAEKMQHENTSG